jgi:hypothetical protein
MFDFSAILDVHGLSILSTWLKHLNGFSCNCVTCTFFLALCFQYFFKKIWYPLFGYCFCFSVVCNISSGNGPLQAETVFMHVPALHSDNFDVCLSSAVSEVEQFDFSGVFHILNSEL